jgi:dTDP-4-amino-4,6-dideoxygalactose transaminase
MILFSNESCWESAVARLEKEAFRDSRLKGIAQQSLPFPGWPYIGPDEIEAVAQVLKSGRINYWTGSQTRDFESEYAFATATRHAIAVANGTVSLELALLVLDIGPGDEVVTTPRTFMASASCVALRGATPVFADVDRDSQNVTAATIAAVLTARTKAIIVVHLAGWPCEMDPILELARAHGIAVIEDCAQAHGAMYRERAVGGIGDFGSFSFCQDKIITTGGEGGMLVLNDAEHWARAWAYKDHGKSYDAVYHREHEPGFRWLHESFGTNMRMTEMQAAIGRLQLSKLPGWLATRRRNAHALLAGLRDVAGLRVPEPPSHMLHAYYKFYAFLEVAKLRSSWSRERVMNEITSRGVPCFSGSCSEIYLERAFDNYPGRPRERLPTARELGASSLALLVHPTLDLAHMERAVAVTRSALEAAIA